MSSKFSLLTSAMPTFTKKTAVEAKVDALVDYQVQLLEYLRYSMSNLDADNFNPSGLKQILEPVVVEIKGMEDQFTSLSITVDGFKTTVEGYEKSVDGYEKQVSSFEQTVGGFSATVEGYSNDVEGYEAAVGSYTKQVSSFNQTVNGFNTTVKSYEQKVAGYTQQVSSFEQTASSISAKVSGVANSSGNVTAASIVAAINKAGSTVKISADHVDISGDLVTISDLAGTGKVEINAGNIAANGTISGCRLETATGGITNIVIDDDYIKFTNYASIQIGSDGRMGIFSERSQLDITGYGGIRFFDADRFPSGYWELYAWGMAFIDARTGEPVRHITAVNYT